MYSCQDRKCFHARCFFVTVEDKHGIFVSFVLSINDLRGFLFKILDDLKGLWNSFPIKTRSSKNCGFVFRDQRCKGTEVKFVHRYVTQGRILQQNRWNSFL